MTWTTVWNCYRKTTVLLFRGKQAEDDDPQLSRKQVSFYTVTLNLLYYMVLFLLEMSNAIMLTFKKNKYHKFIRRN